MNTIYPLQKARRINANTAAHPSRVPTIVEPVTAAVASATSQEIEELAAEGGGGSAPCRYIILPYGLGADNDSFIMRVIVWRRVALGGVTLWVPTPVAQLTCTMSAAVGVAGSPVLATERFCDTLVVSAEPTLTADVTRSGTLEVFSPGNDLVGWVCGLLYPGEKLELSFADNVTAPTKNALIGLIG